MVPLLPVEKGHRNHWQGTTELLAQGTSYKSFSMCFPFSEQIFPQESRSGCSFPREHEFISVTRFVTGSAGSEIKAPRGLMQHLNGAFGIWMNGFAASQHLQVLIPQDLGLLPVPLSCLAKPTSTPSPLPGGCAGTQAGVSCPL